MVKGKTEEKSDDIEISSIGKLYTGPWDKKYWSSSRGKDRYPYPVGYTSVRVQNGVTYKMEIREGVKGPLFTISSSDGNLSSGDTPDIAWDNFQKKGGSQIKLKRGKRFSCKIDGVELFGFKNSFVQRLLRELVANDSGTEHGSSTSHVVNRAPKSVNKLQVGELVPDPIPCLVQTKFTRKRNRTSVKVSSTEVLAETPNQHKHGELAKEVSALNSKQRGKSDGIDTDPSAVPDIPIAERGLLLDPIDMSDHPEGHRSRSEETDGDCKAEHGMPADANLFAPDTLDHAGDNLCVSSLDKDGQLTCNVKDATVNDESKSKILPTDSQPKDDTGTSDSCTFSENCFTDSVDHEFVKTMMACLLPQAVPLLKTFTRKKRKRSKPEDVSVHGCQEKSSVSISSPDDRFISRKLVEQSNISSTGHDPLVPAFGYTQSVVPDSLDNDDPVDPKTSKCDEDPCGLRTRQLTIGTSGDAKSVPCLSGSKKHEIISLIEKPPKARELVQQSNHSSTGHDSLVSTSGYTQCVVPDSLDNDDPVDPKTSKCDENPCGLRTRQLTIGTSGDAKSVPCLSGSKKHEIISLIEKPPKARELVQQSNHSSTGHDSLVSTSGYTQSVVPDSLDYDDPVNRIPNISKRDIDSNGLDTCAQLNKDGKTVLCLRDTKMREINLYSQARSSSTEKPLKVRKLVEQSNISSTCQDSLVSTPGSTQSVVPDSLDNDDPGYYNMSKCDKDSYGLGGRQLTIGTIGDAKSVLCLSGSKKHEIISLIEKPPKAKELVEQSHVSSTGHDSLVSTSGYTQSVVPDSLGTDDPVNPIPNSSKGDKVSNSLDTCAQLTNRDAKTVLCHSETKKREINLQSQASNSSSQKPPKVRKLVEQSNISSKCQDSLVSSPGYTQSVVPDSLDNDDPGDKDKAPNTTEGYKDLHSLDTREQLAIGTYGDAKMVLCLDETKKREINLQGQARSSSSEKPPKGPVLAPDTKIIAYSKTRQKICPSIGKPPSIPVSIAKASPGLKIINYKSPANANFSKRLEARGTKKLPNVADLDCHGVSTSYFEDSSAVNNHNISANGEIKNCPSLSIQKLNNNPHGLLDLFASYFLPMPISTVQLIVKEDNVYVCVRCCSEDHKTSTLFVYSASNKGENIGCPSLIGHLPLGLESSKDTLGGDSAADNSIFQFIPDAQFLVLRNNIKTSFCRERKLHCLCSACTSDCLQKNALKIVQINSGYASLVTRLDTAQEVRCFLVCEPSFLLAADDGGKLKLWTMNSSWSTQMQHCYLPAHDSMLPCLVELKGIPKSTVLVIGHNGLGGFGLWDVEKGTLVSRFSSPEMSVSRCIPACVFKWQKSEDHRTKKLIGEIMDATKTSFAERYENHNFSAEDKDSAIWLLISTVSDPDSQFYQSSEQQEENPIEYWRLALLINNTVILGSALDSGAAAVTSAGRGIIGTGDGLVYIWELSTGKKLGNLHSFKGSDSRISCITSDTSNSGAVAVASGSQLLVYLPS